MRYLETQVRDLNDAVGLAMELQIDFSYGLVLVFLNDSGTVVGYVIFDQPHHNICDVHEWLDEHNPMETHCVIVDIIHHDPDQLTDADLGLFELKTRI